MADRHFLCDALGLLRLLLSHLLLELLEQRSVSFCHAHLHHIHLHFFQRIAERLQLLLLDPPGFIQPILLGGNLVNFLLLPGDGVHEPAGQHTAAGASARLLFVTILGRGVPDGVHHILRQVDYLRHGRISLSRLIDSVAQIVVRLEDVKLIVEVDRGQSVDQPRLVAIPLGEVVGQTDQAALLRLILIRRLLFQLLHQKLFDPLGTQVGKQYFLLDLVDGEHEAGVVEHLHQELVCHQWRLKDRHVKTCLEGDVVEVAGRPRFTDDFLETDGPHAIVVLSFLSLLVVEITYDIRLLVLHGRLIAMDFNY